MIFRLILITLLGFSFVSTRSQDTAETQKPCYQFETLKKLESTTVKNQHRSGTCWSYAAVSILESELIRLNKGKFDLSEMFFVRLAYLKKAQNYIRFHGLINFGPGGQAHDVFQIIKKHGIAPENSYTGLVSADENHVHGEMDALLKSMLNAVIKNPNGKLSPNWHKAFESVLDVYLGKLPNKILYNEKSYTPEEFAVFLNIKPDDYIEITSYTHHPFYSKIILEIPDNWNFGQYYNIPIDDLLRVMDHSLMNGYTLCWDGDVSEKGFSHKNGVAIIPDVKNKDISGTERDKWEKLTEKEREAQIYKFDKPYPEKKVTQEMRQNVFDNYSATDDHLMHITGIAKDQNGTKYFITKNSWSDDSNDKGGFLNISETYVRLNTIAILVHKEAVPLDIKKKMGL